MLSEVITKNWASSAVDHLIQPNFRGAHSMIQWFQMAQAQDVLENGVPYKPPNLGQLAPPFGVTLRHLF